MKYKVCSKCKVSKPHSEYFKDNRRKIGIRCRCKPCCKSDTIHWRSKNKSHYNNYVAQWRAINPERQHKTEIKRRYGLSIDRYNQMLLDQDYKCAICSTQHNPSRKRGRLYVDHNHKTGEIRGLLCGDCNSALGHLNDDVTILENAIKFLEKIRAPKGP